MIIEATLQEIDTGKVWDVSDLICGSMKWSTEIGGSFPGKLDFKLLEDPQLTVQNGDLLTVKIDGQDLFKGTIRKKSFQQKNGLSLVAYDSMIFLKSKDTVVFGVGNASSRFAQVCQLANVPYNVIDQSDYNCPEWVADQKTFFEMIQESIDQTRKATKSRYMITDSFGKLEFLSLNRLISTLVLGDESLVTDYTFESSIEEAYNSIKVIKEDSKDKTRTIALAKDDKSIARWGLLQDVATPEESEMNQAQMQNQADNLLKESNKETKTLSLECLGRVGIKAGSTITLEIEKLRKEGLYGKQVLVTRCEHTFDKIHTMSLELEVL